MGCLRGNKVQNLGSAHGLAGVEAGTPFQARDSGSTLKEEGRAWAVFCCLHVL